MVKELLKKTNLTEEEFLEIVNAGMQNELQLETEITLSNPLGTTDVWVVADVNHDGITGTVDLISKNLICDSTANAYTTNNSYWGSSQIYRDSTIRSWLTGTYITGFSTAIQNALKTMDVITDGSDTVQDKIKLLSMNEVGFSNSDWGTIPTTVEGTRYPIFEKGDGFSARTKRKKYKANGSTAGWYWTRSRITGYSGNVWGVGSYGSYSGSDYANATGGVVAAVRF